MGAVAEKMGLGPLTANTAQLMASRRRLFALPKAVDAVLGLIAVAVAFKLLRRPRPGILDEIDLGEQEQAAAPSGSAASLDRAA